MRPVADAPRASQYSRSPLRHAPAIASIMSRSTIPFALAALLALTACNVNHFTATMTAKMLVDGSAALDREADVEFAAQAFPASLKTLETFLVNAPEDENLLFLLARGYNSYAFGILESDLDEAKLHGPNDKVQELERRAKMHYLRGSEYGFRLLGRDKLRDAALSNDMATLQGELARLKAEDAPALFWATYGWASTINLSMDDPDMMAYLTPAETMMKRVYELDPDYNGGAPILFFGVLEASKPPAFGGKPDVAKKFFDEAMAKHGDSNLLIPLLYARFYCPLVQDRKLFDDLIAKVEQADVTAFPEMRLNNEIARERARLWKANVAAIILE
jgi:hypothetical protein